MQGSENFWAIVPAAGIGKRMDADKPKQYLELRDKTIIEHTLDRLVSTNIFTGIVVAIAKEDSIWPKTSISNHPLIIVAPGGKERAGSVLSALNALNASAKPDDWVLVHDAARCCITVNDIHRLIKVLNENPEGGILALPVHDTIKKVNEEKIIGTVDRRHIWRALTPQMFRYQSLRNALIKSTQEGHTVTDEASAMEFIGAKPIIVEGRQDNIKITRHDDLALANFYLEQQCLE